MQACILYRAQGWPFKCNRGDGAQDAEVERIDQNVDNRQTDIKDD